MQIAGPTRGLALAGEAFALYVVLGPASRVKKSGKSKMMAVFFFTVPAHEKGFKFHTQPQTGAYFVTACALDQSSHILHYLTISIFNFNCFNHWPGLKIGTLYINICYDL